MRICKCGKTVSDDAMFCPHCGSEMTTSLSVSHSKAKQQLTRMLWIYVAILIVLVVSLMKMGTPELPIFLELILIVGGIIDIIAIVALFRFKNWGRKLWLVTTFADFLLILLLPDFYSLHPIENMLSSILTTLNGVLLAMIWLEPYNSLFKKDLNKENF